MINPSGGVVPDVLTKMVVRLKNPTSFRSNIITDSRRMHSGSELPNPFKRSTEISYMLAQSYHCSLRVFDLLGREMRRSKKISVTAGSYAIACAQPVCPPVSRSTRWKRGFQKM